MEYFQATGKRKRATAQVILKQGKGKIRVNGKAPEAYFGRDDLLKYIESPLKTIRDSTSKVDTNEVRPQFDVIAHIKGGGISGQAGALVLGISRALLKFDPELRKELKSNGFLKRDPRETERKKYGKKKARKSFQWTKR